MRSIIFFLSLAVLSMTSCGEKSEAPNTAVNKTKNSPPAYTYEVVNTYNHDPEAFTQGLEIHDGVMYESTGGKKLRKDPFFSSLRKVELQSGKVLQKLDMRDDVFAEGMTIFNNKIYQLTWTEGICFVYDLATFKLEKEVKYPGEGWGLTHDDKNLFLSDGTHVIRILDPETFETVRTISVFDAQGKPMMELNELEYVKGELWANVWQEDFVVRIDPASGKLLGTIDLKKLVKDATRDSKKADVLNGIAYDPAGDKIFVTGKKWDKLFEIKVVSKPQ
jgi:glutaminyl-peptide cyclotransferase